MKGKGEEPSSCYHWGMASRELKWTRRTTENGGSASQPLSLNGLDTARSDARNRGRDDGSARMPEAGGQPRRPTVVVPLPIRDARVCRERRTCH
jgi:hypothetical protein